MENPAADRERVAVLREQLDRYLIGDLETMLDVTKPGLGYPMIQTILSGMEIVGMLLSESRNAGASDKFFNELVWDEPKYKPARNVFRAAIRNKTSHIFLVHTGIQLTKTGHGHLTRTADGLLNVDLVTLFTDFRRTYTRVMDEIADGDRDAPGLQAIVSELTEMTGEIQQLAAGLSEYPEPELERTKTVPSGTLLDQSDYQGGSVTSVPAASATKFPYT